MTDYYISLEDVGHAIKTHGAPMAKERLKCAVHSPLRSKEALHQGLRVFAKRKQEILQMQLGFKTIRM